MAREPEQGAELGARTDVGAESGIGSSCRELIAHPPVATGGTLYFFAGLPPG